MKTKKSSVPKKRKNQTDATLRNVRAGKSRDAKLEARIQDLERRVLMLESYGSF